MSKKDYLTDLHKDMIQWRRTLHQHPQIAFEEEFASAFIAEKLTEWDIPFKRDIAGTGIVATITGKSTDSDKSIGLRADIDALPIEESLDKPWKSQCAGKMHGCGHDGHTVMLLGAAKYLQETRNFNGITHLIFQPAEEIAKGADTMIEEGLFDDFPCDQIYGLHNMPTIPAGTIAIRHGAVMAFADGFSLTIKGHGAHGAYPHKSVDPILIAAQVVTALQSIVSRTVHPAEMAVVTVASIHGGSAFNIIPDDVKITGTVRCLKGDTRDRIQNQIDQIASNIAQAHGGSATLDYTPIARACFNDALATDTCIRAAGTVLGNDNVDQDFPISMGGDDFGSMSEIVPGCYVFFGQGQPDEAGAPHSQSLHAPDYDFNDDILTLGAEYWAELVEIALPV